ncbi:MULTISPECIES: hypothetical protein [unclassified Streptomyces]|uniref:hypothetical protein n=1 Tax=unclassified Streptomyces TaxID=2593676 RepID=UPI00225B8B1D|nr:MULTISPECIES: hypothetical protein [unclassified Streptomyces]MCX4649391.1 hypothetical protein [Streptomyces sp. NBC_01446]MCX5321410.1 hypothetical protein [Streptomyces sp. NBC_00120]
MPADTPMADLVRLAKIRWRIEHDYRELSVVDRAADPQGVAAPTAASTRYRC